MAIERQRGVESGTMREFQEISAQSTKDVSVSSDSSDLLRAGFKKTVLHAKNVKASQTESPQIKTEAKQTTVKKEISSGKCSVCGKECKNKRSFQIHAGKMHKDLKTGTAVFEQDQPEIIEVKPAPEPEQDNSDKIRQQRIEEAKTQTEKAREFSQKVSKKTQKTWKAEQVLLVPSGKIRNAMQNLNDHELGRFINISNARGFKEYCSIARELQQARKAG